MDRGVTNVRHVHALTAVGELLRDHPGVLDVLDSHGIVFCAGCYLALMDPLADVVGYHAVHDPEALMRDLERAVDQEETALRAPLSWTVDPARQAELARWEDATGTLAAAGALLASAGSGWVLLRARDAGPLEIRLPGLVLAGAEAAMRTRRTEPGIVRTFHYERSPDPAGGPGEGTGSGLEIRAVLEDERGDAVRILVRVSREGRLAAQARVDLGPALPAAGAQAGQGRERASVR